MAESPVQSKYESVKSAPTTVGKHGPFHTQRKAIRKFLNTTQMQLFLGAILMISLFFPDSWVLANAPDHRNDSKDAVLLSVFIIFIVEMGLLLFAQDGYNVFNFYFWMDVLGTFSMIIDIGWIADSFIPAGSVAAQGAVIRATRAAKLAARYGRLLRLMRLSRFLKLLPCFKSNEDEHEYEPTMAAIKRVSNKLSDVLSIRTAILVLILVIVIPFLNYTSDDYSYETWITNAKMIAKNETVTSYDIENLARKCNNFYKPKDSNILRLKIESPYLNETFKEKYWTRETLRNNNKLKYLSEYYIDYNTLINSGNSAAYQYAINAEDNGRLTSDGNAVKFKVSMWVDTTIGNQTASMFNILIIIMVIILLFTFTGSFNTTVNELVVQPLEKMMKTLRNSATVMLKSMKAFENAQAQEEEKNDRDSKSKRNSDDDESSNSDIDETEMETAKLEKMVEKLYRIVQHIAPTNNEIADENIDKATASWLNQNYSKGVSHEETVQVHRAESVIGDHNHLTQLENIISSNIITQLNTWDFDVVEHSHDTLHLVMEYIFTSLGFLDEFNVPEQIFKNFVIEISERYINSNTYHNYKHGCDVCFTSFRLLTTSQLSSVFTTFEVFSVLIGAFAHDVGHPGLNNVYLVNTRHELAVLHNDRSPLENMHCNVLYEILSKGSTNIFVNFTKKQWVDSRKIILTIILGTDMAHHAEQVRETKKFLEVHGEDTKAYCCGAKETMDCMKDDKNRMFIMELVLHCSDISNPFKPFKLCAKWADLVVEEFCQQGDKEKSLGLVISPMCDRAALNLYNMQMGFIEFAVAPLITTFVKIFPPLHEIGSNILNNFKEWGEGRKAEIRTDANMPAEKKPEELSKLDARISKFSDELVFLQEFRMAPLRTTGRKNSTSTNNG